MNYKKHLASVVKLCVALALIWWMIATKKLTFDPFARLIERPFLLILVLGCNLFVNIIAATRWYLLLRAVKLAHSYLAAVSLSFVGIFFNYAVPGSVGGDLVKGYYVLKHNPKAKLLSATTVFLDRIVGLHALVLLGTLATLLNIPLLSLSPISKSLGTFLVMLNFGFLVFWIFVGLKNLPSFIPKKILSFVSPLQQFGSHKKSLALTILISIASHSISIGSLYFVAINLGFDGVSLSTFVFVFAVGSIATAIPISPGGLGVGQTVFLALFTLLQYKQPELGPFVITLSQMIQAFTSLIGAVIYFSGKGGIKTIQAGASQK